MDTLYQLLEWNPVQVGSTFQGVGVAGGWGGNHGQDNNVPCGCKRILHSFLYELICINSKWLNRVEGRSSVGWGVGGNHGQDNDVPCGCKGLLHSFK